MRATFVSLMLVLAGCGSLGIQPTKIEIGRAHV